MFNGSTAKLQMHWMFPHNEEITEINLDQFSDPIDNWLFSDISLQTAY